MYYLVINGKIREVMEDMENLILPQTYILGNEEKSMKIEKMTIDNINGIKQLDLTFNKELNLICGENGVGKTTILKSISYYFIEGNKSHIKKHYGTEKGQVKLYFSENKMFQYEITDFSPGNIRKTSSDYQLSDYLLYFPTFRSIKYEKLKSVPTRNEVFNNNKNNHSSNLLSLGAGADIKKWFVNVYVFSKVGSISIHQQENLGLCCNIFNLLDENLIMETVDTDCEILLRQNKDKIFFEMLSDGYKSCIIILFGIIKEVEYRFPKINVSDFNGIIMIDEIDIHLHPQWQAKLVKVLKETFPKAQIIATTHSPSVLQNAKTEEIIPLYKDENGDIHIKELHLGEYGLQGWTLEEIMKDVMGMESTTSDLYAQTIKEFDDAMYEENVSLIKEKYETLCKMLHPQSTLRQLLKIQMAGMEE